MTIIIQTDRLSKQYTSGKTVISAVKNLSLSVNQGEIFGFLGPNGAGKTTTIRMLIDLIRPTTGTATLFGMDSLKDSVSIHRKIGFLPAELSLWKGYRAKEVVQYLARIRGDEARIIKEANRLAERLQLDLSKRVRDFSTGNKRKLGLVIAMMHKPELLILDEPTNGLDPLMQQLFNQMMLEVKQEGRTVFLSSHMLSEVQAICERVAIVRDGELKAVESVEKLTKVGFRKVQFTLKDSPTESLLTQIKGLTGASSLHVHSHSLEMNWSGDFDALLKTINATYIKDALITEPTLEEIFLAFYDDSSSASTHNGKAN